MIWMVSLIDKIKHLKCLVHTGVYRNVVVGTRWRKRFAPLLVVMNDNSMRR